MRQLFGQITGFALLFLFVQQIDQVTKLYSKLPPKQQATLAFDAISQENEKEAEAILHFVEWQNYYGIHADYRKQAIGLIMLSHTYALEHFRARAMLFEAYKYYAEGGFTDDTLAILIHSAYQRLANLEMALNRLGEEHHFNTESVRKFGHCSRINPEHLADHDEEGVAEAYYLLSSSLAIG
jgi:hypothetical protein